MPQVDKIGRARDFPIQENEGMNLCGLASEPKSGCSRWYSSVIDVGRKEDHGWASHLKQSRIYAARRVSLSVDFHGKKDSSLKLF